MQRLLRKVGKFSSKSKHETGAYTTAGESRVISAPTPAVDPGGVGASEAKSPPPQSSSCVNFTNGTARRCEEIDGDSSQTASTKLSQAKKKRNSLIESFRKLKRHSRSKDLRRSVPSISETIPPRVNEEEVRPEVVGAAAAVCESETTADDQCPSTREMSVNGDVTSLSLSVLTLRSLGSAEASAGHSFSRPDTSSEVVDSVSNDAGRAEFLAKEVPGPVVLVSDPEAQLPALPRNVAENQISSQFNSISISPLSVPTQSIGDPPSPVPLSSEKQTELQPSSLSQDEWTVQLSFQLPAHVSTDAEVVNRASDYDAADGGGTGDDLGEDGIKIHDTIPVDLLYTPAKLENECSSTDDSDHLPGKGVALNGTGTLPSTDPEDHSYSGAGNGRWSLMHELIQLSRHGWYWGPISREEAEDKLTDQPEGAFLIRDSTDERYLFSLSFRSFNRTLHTRIEYCNGEFSFYHLPHSEGYRSLVDLIENAIHDSLNGIFYYSRSNVAGSHSYAVKLTKPVSRFTQVRSLQYLCRFIIRQHTRVDHIQNLPLPVTVKSWLRESQY